MRKGGTFPRVAPREKERTEFGKRLKAAREHAAKTQPEVVRELHIPQSTLAEAERHRDSCAWTVRLAKHYGVSALWLECGEGEMLAAPPAAQEWPFKRIQPEAWAKLSADDRAVIDYEAFRALSNLKGSQVAPAPAPRKPSGRAA